MNIENLEIGKEYKNYAKLCEVLEIIPKTSNSKKSQIKEMKRRFDFKKAEKGNGLIITEIYNEIKPKEENQGNLPNYIKYMELLLLQCLQGNKTKKMTISKIKLAEQLKMIHSDFNKYYGKRKELSEKLDIELMHIYDFMNTTSNAYKNAINTILKRLESRSIIMYDTRWKTVYKTKWIMEGRIQEQIKTYFATDEEKDIIMKIKYDLLQNYDGNMQNVYREGKLHEFNNEYERLLFEAIGRHNAYKVYDININTSALESEYYKSMEKLRNEVPDGQLKNIINHMWSDKNLERMTNKVDSSLSKINGFDEKLTKYDVSRLQGNFESSMKILNNRLVVSKQN